MKNLRRFGLAGMLIGVFLVPSLALASFDQNLKQGSTGKPVIELQKFLITQKCFAGSATGDYSASTVRGVKCYQGKQKISATGIFSTSTRLSARATAYKALHPATSVTKPAPAPKKIITPVLPPSPVITPPAPTPPAVAPSSGDNTYVNSDGNTIQSPTYYNSAPSGASAHCRDGTYSFSQHRSGTCSGHGGVSSWL